MIPPGSSIRGSSDDLVSFFYTLEHLESWRKRNVVGTPVSGSDYPCFVDDPDQMYMLAFKVVCMGDSNAVDLAQETHLNALQNKGCMDDSELLEFSRTFPAGPTYEGLYIDDHAILQLVRNRASGRLLTHGERKEDPPPRDKHLLTISREAYVEAGWARSNDKAQEFQGNFTIWNGSRQPKRQSRCTSQAPMLDSPACFRPD